ncbi:MAG: hypothetical protein ACF8PN_14155 [Phycisphaerales bacterium]
MKGRVYLVGDDIRADAIVARAYATFDLNDSGERAELAATAFDSLRDEYGPFIASGETRSPYTIVVAGELFGAGAGAAHAAAALGEAGVRAVIAASFGPEFERIAVNEGHFFPLRGEAVAIDSFRSHLSRGDEVSINLETMTLQSNDGAQLALAPLGVVRTIVEAGGLAAFLESNEPVEGG